MAAMLIVGLVALVLLFFVIARLLIGKEPVKQVPMFDRPAPVVEDVQQKHSATVSLQFSSNTPQSKKIGDLNKQATALKSTDLTRAIELLQESQKLSKHENYPIKHFLRLPLFLQSAGRMNEALDEFNRLLEHVKPPEKKIIYDKMRLAYQREKNTKMVARYKLLTDQAAIEAEEYFREQEIEQQNERARLDKKMADITERLHGSKANQK